MKTMINQKWVRENPEQATAKINALMEAIEPFIERPTIRMDPYPCHYGITSKEKCGRCSRAIAAFKAFNM